MLARKIAMIAVAIGSIIGSAAATTGAQAATARPAVLGQRLMQASSQVIYSHLINQAHGLCLDAVRSGDGSNGDLVQLYHCNKGNNQYWGGINSEQRNLAHGLCLDAIRQDDGSNGDFVQLYHCNGGANQKWHLRFYHSGGFEIVNDAHGLCLDADRQADGRNYDYIQLWRCNGGSNQVWEGGV